MVEALALDAADLVHVEAVLLGDGQAGVGDVRPRVLNGYEVEEHGPAVGLGQLRGQRALLVGLPRDVGR